MRKKLWLIPILTSLCGTVLLAVEGIAQESPRSIYLRFETPPAKGISDNGAALQHGTLHSAVTPGKLIAIKNQTNAGSVKFDGNSSIVFTKMPSQTVGFSENFTWEGFFFAPASNRYQTETGIANRLITQFVDAKGAYTRLTIGLACKKANGPPFLCVNLEGNEGRTFVPGKVEVTSDCWHHFALVHEGTKQAAQVTWYLDYQQCGELFLGGQASRNTLKPAGTAPFTIGARLLDGKQVNRGFIGLIDEVRITPQKLSPNEFLRIRELDVPRRVTLRLMDSMPESFDWSFSPQELDQGAELLKYEAFALPGLPPRVSRWNTLQKRTAYSGFVLDHEITLPKSEYQLALQTRDPAQLRMDGRVLIDARNSIKPHPLTSVQKQPGTKNSQKQKLEFFTSLQLDGKPHSFQLTGVISPSDNAESGEVIVSYAPVQKVNAADGKLNLGEWHLLGGTTEEPLNSASWATYRRRNDRYLARSREKRRQLTVTREDAYWRHRHASALQAISNWPQENSAVKATTTSHLIDAYLGIKKNEMPLVNDAGFLRRLSLDIRGRIPTLTEVKSFLADDRANKRTLLIDQM